jgi:hypothetical protein
VKDGYWEYRYSEGGVSGYWYSKEVALSTGILQINTETTGTVTMIAMSTCILRVA